MSRLVRRVARNINGRDIIVGDVHGCFTQLQKALEAISFSAYAGDRLFSVGDLVDRGPESIQVLDWLVQPWFFAVGGNHEGMAARWPNGHMEADVYASNGGAWMMALDRETQREVAAALGALPVAIELATEAGLVGIVHAECPLNNWGNFVAMLDDETLSKTKRGQLIDAAQWSRDRISSKYDGDVEDVRAVVVGHTPMDRMTSLGNTIYIDTMGWKPSGHFTLLDAATLQKVKP